MGRRNKALYIGRLNLVGLFNGSTLRDIDTVQEFADILVLHLSDLLDGSCALGNVLNAGSAEDNLVLLIGHLNGHTLEHGHTADNLFSNKVTDLNALLVIDNAQVDGKVSVGGAHLVLEALGHTLEHVLDVGADRADTGEMLVATKPDAEAEAVLAVAGNLEGNVAKVALKSAAGTGHLDDTAVESDLYTSRNRNGLRSVDVLHLKRIRLQEGKMVRRSKGQTLRTNLI